MTATTPAPAKRSAPALIVAWLIVAIPAGWGISQTIRKSLALFTSAQPPVTAPAPAPGQTPPR